MLKQVDQVNQLTSTPPDAVFEAMHALMHTYRARRVQALESESCCGLTHMESKALGFFARHPGATASDLVQHAGRDKAQVTRVLSGLRERGLLDARPDESDRRSTRLTLSASGTEAHLAVQRQGERLAQTAIADLSEAERVQLLALLERVRGNLEAG